MRAGTHVRFEDREGYLWITLPDSIDMYSYESIERAITERLLAMTAPMIILDMCDTAHLYSSGVGLLIRLRKKIGDCNGILCLVNVSKTIIDLLRTINLEKIFSIFPTDVEFEISQEDLWRQTIKDKTVGFIFAVQVEDKICRIMVSGHMATSHALTEFESYPFPVEPREYVFDLTGLETIDSHGVTILTSILKEIEDRQGICVSYGANPVIEDFLECMSITVMMPSFQDEAKALAGIKRNAARKSAKE